jgi:hypothetical protein
MRSLSGRRKRDCRIGTGKYLIVFGRFFTVDLASFVPV